MYFKNATAHRLGRYELSSPSTKESQSEGVELICPNGFIVKEFVIYTVESKKFKNDPVGLNDSVCIICSRFSDQDVSIEICSNNDNVRTQKGVHLKAMTSSNFDLTVKRMKSFKEKPICGFRMILNDSVALITTLKKSKAIFVTWD